LSILKNRTSPVWFRPNSDFFGGFAVAGDSIVVVSRQAPVRQGIRFILGERVFDTILSALHDKSAAIVAHVADAVSNLDFQLVASGREIEMRVCPD
jgi:hypothetical protein